MIGDLSRAPETTESEELDSSNLSARRAGAEAVEVGRSAARQLSHQGEQLTNADRLADKVGERGAWQRHGVKFPFRPILSARRMRIYLE